MAESSKQKNLVLDGKEAGRWELNDVPGWMSVSKVLFEFIMDRANHGECCAPTQWFEVTISGIAVDHSMLVSELTSDFLVVQQKVGTDGLASVYEQSSSFLLHLLRTGMPRLPQLLSMKHPVLVKTGIEEAKKRWLVSELVVQSLLLPNNSEVEELASELARFAELPHVAAPVSVALLGSNNKRLLEERWMKLRQPSTRTNPTENRCSESYTEDQKLLSLLAKLKASESEYLFQNEIMAAASVIADEMERVGVSPEEVYSEIDIDKSHFDLDQSTNRAWQQVIKLIHAGASTKIPDGKNGLAQFIKTLQSRLPNNQRLKLIVEDYL